jgi:CDP-glucose 4,6-dehydratase
MRYLITGHTGFKGSWLAAILKSKGHETYGISLPPAEKSLFKQANIHQFLDRQYFLDIRDFINLNIAIKEINPEVIVHLAAQPLVSYSYKDPIYTYQTNVMGTLNVLEATRNLSNLVATLIITTDKVYKNTNKKSGYIESDPLGGDDPYSSSKAAADIASQSWRESFGVAPIAIARAGNVIGGGDWASDRIVPDATTSIMCNQPLVLRNPNSIRPWQHVLDCLNGYLYLIDKQMSDGIQGEWNFGPDKTQVRNVANLVDEFSKNMKVNLDVKLEPSDFKENNLLLLDSTKSKKELSWSEKLNFEQSVEWTAEWYLDEKNPQKALMGQIERFFSL